MCLISTEVNQVSNTKIFIAPNTDKSRQITIYSNNIDNISNGNAMILPVPQPETLRFHNLSEYKNFFDDCKNCFYNATNSLKSYSLNMIDKAEGLAVFKIGAYYVSVAKNIQQLEMVNNKVFKLSDGLKKILNTYYYQPYWGFIICRLSPGNNNYHPFAYSHQIIQNKIYIPTRHYHELPDLNDVNNVNNWSLGLRLGLDGSNPIGTQKWDENNIDKSPMFLQSLSSGNTAEAYGWLGSTKKSNLQESNLNDKTKQTKVPDPFNETVDDWSHEIYFYNINPYVFKPLRTMNSSKYEWDNESIPDLRKINFSFGKCISFEKIIINGEHPNIDISF
jgi:hypothetical protein